MNKLDQSRIFLWILPVSAWAVISILSFFIPAAGDDWYSSTPIVDFSWRLFLPKNTFWRPIEPALRLLLGQIPFAFPYLNHLLIVIAHGLTAYIISKITGFAGLSKRTTALACAVFLISPAVCATVFSVDGLNQAWSTALGFLSVWSYLRFKRPGNIIGWLSFAMIATLFKESGVAWFAAAPLVAVAVEGKPLLNRSQMFRIGWSVLIGVCGAVFYLALRFALRSDIVLGSESGRYSLHLSSIVWLKNIMLLVGLSTTAIDTLAVFLPPRNIILAAASFAASIPLMILTALGILRNRQKARILLLITSAAVVSMPHLLIEHPGEMHAYPTFAVLALLMAFAVDDLVVSSRRSIAFAIGLFLLASIGVGMHKWQLMYSHSLTAVPVARSIDAQTTEKKPETVLVVIVKDNLPGYSVFYQDPAKASAWGMSVIELWEWKYPKKFLYADDKESAGKHYDAMWVVYANGRVVVKPGGTN